MAVTITYPCTKCHRDAEVVAVNWQDEDIFEMEFLCACGNRFEFTCTVDKVSNYLDDEE